MCPVEKPVIECAGLFPGEYRRLHFDDDYELLDVVPVVMRR
jgi:hypothetical protein